MNWPCILGSGSSPRDAVLALSPLDAAVAVRGLNVHWAFMYNRDLDAALLVDALAVGLGRYCLPRHRMPFYSRNEGSKCVGRRDVASTLSVRLYLAVALVEFPVLAGRVRVKKQTG